MSNLPDKRTFSHVALSDNSDTALSTKVQNKNDFVNYIKETVTKDFPEIADKAKGYTKNLLDGKGLENLKLTSETQNLDADTQKKYQELELLEIQKYKEVEELKRLKLDNEREEMANKSAQEFLDYLKSQGIPCYVDGNGTVNFFQELKKGN